MKNRNIKFRDSDLSSGKTRFGPYTVEANSVARATKDEPQMILGGGVVTVHLCTKDSETGEVSYVLKGHSTLGDAFEQWVPAARLLNANDLASDLSKAGFHVMDPKHVATFLKMTADDIDGQRVKTLVAKVGWCMGGTAFYDGRNLFLPQGDDLSAFYCKELDSPAHEAGSLDEWYDNIGSLIEANPVLLGTATLALASLILPKLGLSSRVFNFHGGKGMGKTLALQTAATLFGNGIDPAAGAMALHRPFVQKFETTINGIEAVLGSCSPFPALLDELTEQGVASIGNLMYKAASGGGKHRLTPDGKAAARNAWCQVVLTSSECSIAESCREAGTPLRGGQADRGIDIPVDELGVFTEFGTHSTFDAVTRHLKRVCGEYYGTPSKAFMQHLMQEPDTANAIMAFFPDVEDELLPDGCGDGERRVIKHFAAAVIAGYLAISADVFKCSDEVVLEAIRTLVEKWWAQRANSLQVIATYLRDNSKRIIHGSPQLDQRAAAYFQDGNIIIPRDAFSRAFGEEAQDIVAELNALNALKGDQKGRRTRRFCNNRLWAYVIPADRIPATVEDLIDDESDTAF